MSTPPVVWNILRVDFKEIGSSGFLNDGWEPFAVTVDDDPKSLWLRRTVETVWLRRPAREQ